MNKSASETREENLGEIHRNAATKLAAASQRYTSNRRTIVVSLHRALGPSTIGEILEVAPELAQSSTYRNLVVLEQVGVVHRIVTADDHARYELDEEITGHHHHHLVCEVCGLILDITLPPDLEEAIDSALGSAAGHHRFSGIYHRVDLMGHCDECAPR